MFRGKCSKIWLGAFLLLSSFGVSLFVNTNSAHAADFSLPTSKQIYSDLSAHQHYWWLYGCFTSADIDKVTPSEVDGWDFFQGSGAISTLGAMYGKSSGQDFAGDRSCDDESVVKAAFNYLGFNDSRDTFCSIPGRQYGGKNVDSDTCRAGVGGDNWDNNADKSTRAKWFKDTAEPKKPVLKAEDIYLRAYLTLTNKDGCGITYLDDTLYDNASDVPGTSANNKYAIGVITKDSKGTLVVKYIQGIGINSKQVPVVAQSNNGISSETCKTLAKETRDNVASYLAKVIKLGVDDTIDSSGDTTKDNEDDKTTCAIDGIGWIICPVINFMAKLNDKAYAFLSDNFLQVKAGLVTDSSTEIAWKSFRDIANVAFVIAFLFIVYAQMTGTGVSNYGIKKLLPKLIIAAVLVNVSYYICQIAVDVSNILGTSIVDLFKAISVGDAGDKAGVVGSTWESVATGALIGGATVGLLVLIVLAPSVLLVVGLIVLILVARQVFLILLIVISPLAFVAYLLPNTEEWFRKWWKAFSALLLVFPIVGLVFGASALASKITLNVAGDDQQMIAIVALAIQAIPLFAVPAILKGALAAAGSVGQKINSFADKSGKKSIQNSRLGAMKTQFDRNKQVSQAKRWGGRGNKYDPRTYVNRGLNRSTGSYGSRIAASGAEVESKIASEDVDRRAILMQKQAGWTAATTIPKAQEELSNAIKANDTTRARAAQKILLNSGSKGVAGIGDTLDSSVTADNKDSGTVTFLKSDLTSAGLKGKDAALDAWSRDLSADGTAGTNKVSDIAAQPKTLNGLNDLELAGQSADRLKAGAISSTRAADIMNNQQVWANLSEDKKIEIRKAAGPTAPPESNNQGGPGSFSWPS